MQSQTDKIVDGFRSAVIERRDGGASEFEVYRFLADAEKALIDQGWDFETRLLVMRRFRSVIRDAFKPKEPR